MFASTSDWRWPDFTLEDQGEEYYWEHLGMLADDGYAKKWARKKAWYERHFPGRLITTEESSTLSQEIKQIITTYFGVEPVET